MKKPIDPNLNIDQDEILENMRFDKKEKIPFELVENSIDEKRQGEKKLNEASNRVDNSIDVEDVIKEFSKSENEHRVHSDSLQHHSSDSHHGSSHHSSEHHSSSHHSSSHHSSSHHSSGHHSSSHHSSSHHNHKHRHGSHRHSKKKKLPIALKIVIAILLIIAIAVTAIVGTYAALTITGKQSIKPNIENVSEDYQDIITYNGHTYKYNEDLLAFAFIGVDQEDMKTVNETDFVGAADADVVVTIDSKTGKASVIAIPRDTMVDVDIWSQSGIFLRTENTQLCLAYAYGDGSTQSCKSTVKAISRVLYSVPIEKYFALDLSGVAALNDAIGGVTVQSIYDLPSFGIKYGDTVTLEGKAAASYVRTRDMDHVEASLNRVDRQVQYIKAFSQQVLPAVMRDFGTVSRLYNTASKYSQTNISLNNATYIASLLLSKGVRDFDTYTITGKMTAELDPVIKDIAHAQFYPDEEKLMETVLNVFYIQID